MHALQANARRRAIEDVDDRLMIGVHPSMIQTRYRAVVTALNMLTFGHLQVSAQSRFLTTVASLQQTC